ncbi:hypothetical protein QFZ40_002938 [Arthrobacter pascens]|uniref:phosphotransferase n=1 Tax=Arthrobacter pascens TaxID=1677 RepID=UPI0027847475|nr:phosphotransferase [Arthrobacter pascens]MDQ0635029.1 hypothetical protein [Arthrobacter pascens]
MNGDSGTTLPHLDRPPSDEVLADFRAVGTVSKLPGGRGTAWKAGDVTLKPLDVLPEELLWQDEVARRHLGDSHLRLSLPIRSQSERLIVDGWTAFPYLAGEHSAGRWLEIAKIAREFAVIFSGVPRPAFVNMRTHAWARADRFAWSEDHDGLRVNAPYVADLLTARRPVSDPPALIHGDLTGNVLFDSSLPPAVIDLTLYWRPVECSVAVIAMDAVCFEGAALSLLETISPNPAFPQYLVRAALFRIVTDHFNGRPVSDYAPYDDAVSRILELITVQRQD